MTRISQYIEDSVTQFDNTPFMKGAAWLGSFLTCIVVSLSRFLFSLVYSVVSTFLAIFGKLILTVVTILALLFWVMSMVMG